MSSALQDVLNNYRQAALTEREKGTYFEELILCYLRNEASYRDLYSQVWTYADWAKEQGLDNRDTGIDLVAKTAGTDEFHAIQCKLYATDYHLTKSDIDSFFTASGKKPFAHRVIVSSTNHWTEHAEEALRDQQPPVSKIDLFDLENSQIDWAKYQPKKPPYLRDAWCFNAAESSVQENMARTIDFYNAEVERVSKLIQQAEVVGRAPLSIDQLINMDSTKGSWDVAQKSGVQRGRFAQFDAQKIRVSLYRPFTKSWVYFDKFFNSRRYQLPQLFFEPTSQNIVITLKGNWSGEGQIALMVDSTPCDQPDGGVQCFPLYLYGALGRQG